MKKNKILLISFLTLLIVLMVVKLASNKQKINENNKPIDKSNFSIPVNVATPMMLPISSVMVKSGSLIPIEEADIIAPMQGKLVSVRFANGSRVGKGAVLATIDAGLENIGLNDARLRVAKLEKDYRIQRELLTADGTTQARVDEVKLQLDAARNQVAQMQKQVSDNSVRAPISGIITDKMSVAGEFVNPGTPLGKMVNISSMKARVLVGEAEVYQLRLGQSVSIVANALNGEKFLGSISYIAPQGDASHNFPVEITIPNKNERLKAGTIINADFSTSSNQTVMQIPREAIIESLKNPQVFIVKGNKAQLRNIVTGKIIGGYVEVRSGLTLTDTVIISGQINVGEGTKVKVL